MADKNSVTVRSGVDVQSPAGEDRFVTPLADIYETPDAYVLLLDMPGADRGSISVRLEKGTLTAKAPVEALHPLGASVLHREHMAAGYGRAFVLGEDIDPENIDAQFENGVLTLKLFKSEQVKPREITIR